AFAPSCNHGIAWLLCGGFDAVGFAGADTAARTLQRRPSQWAKPKQTEVNRTRLRAPFVLRRALRGSRARLWRRSAATVRGKIRAGLIAVRDLIGRQQGISLAQQQASSKNETEPSAGAFDCDAANQMNAPCRRQSSDAQFRHLKRELH